MGFGSALAQVGAGTRERAKGDSLGIPRLSALALSQTASPHMNNLPRAQTTGLIKTVLKPER